MNNNEKPSENKLKNASNDVKTAKNLTKAAGKALSQNYIGAAKDLAKELLLNPKFFLKLIVILLLPILIIIMLLVSPLAIFYTLISDDSNISVTEIDKDFSQKEGAFDFEKTVKSQISKTVLEAYKKAQTETKKIINKEVLKMTDDYDSFEYSIVDLIGIDGIPDEEIIKLYACFSVLEERTHLNEKYTVDNEFKGEKEKEIFDKDKLIKIIKENPLEFITYQVVDNSNTEEYYDEAIDETITTTYGSFLYVLNFVDTEDIATRVFDLKDNSKNVDVSERLRYDEIKMSVDKEESLMILVNGYKKDSLVVANSVTYKKALKKLKEEGIVFNNINFTPNQKMIFPLKDYRMYITSPYGNRTHPFDSSKTQFHHGVDLGAPSGTKIYPLANGIVLEKGYNDTYGNFVIMYHGRINGHDYITTYLHLIEPAYVIKGNEVDSSVCIGKVGSTGESTGPHLHFAIITSLSNETLVYVDPELYIKEK